MRQMSSLNSVQSHSAPYSTSKYRKARLSKNQTANGKAIDGSSEAFLFFGLKIPEAMVAAFKNLLDSKL